MTDQITAELTAAREAARQAEILAIEPATE